MTLVLMLGLLAGCSRRSSDPKPLPDSTFARVLVELHLAGARRSVDAPYPRGLRDSVFAHYGIRPAAFDTTLKYYSQHPKAFAALYQPIVDSLQMLQRTPPSTPRANMPDSVSRAKSKYIPNR